jgi:hypothetical protein
MNRSESQFDQSPGESRWSAYLRQFELLGSIVDRLRETYENQSDEYRLLQFSKCREQFSALQRALQNEHASSEGGRILSKIQELMEDLDKMDSATNC